MKKSQANVSKGCHFKIKKKPLNIIPVILLPAISPTSFKSQENPIVDQVIRPMYDAYVQPFEKDSGPT